MKEVTAQDIKKELIKDGILKKDNKGFVKIDYLNISTTTLVLDAVGSMIQSWLEDWMKSKKFFFRKPSSQERPDLYLKKKSKKEGLLEIKAFYKTPGFDIQSWNAFLNLMIINPNHLYADYLIFDYQIKKNFFFIENIYLKKIWEISKPMGERAEIKWPINVQYKNKEIVNLRPFGLGDFKNNKKYFDNGLDFLLKVQKTIDMYTKSQDKFKNDKWINSVKKKYKELNNKDLI